MALTRYDVFIKVVSNKSFSKAAEELGYTQSAVSQAINQMEKEMGFRLIDRNRNNLSLTPEGKEMFPYIEKAAECERAIERKVQDIKNPENFTVNIGACQHVSCVLKPEILMEFSNRFPDIRINIINENTEQLNNLLQNSKIDFCIGDIQNDNAEESRVLYKDRYKVVLPCDHELACEPFIDLEKLSIIPQILREGKEVLIFADECRGNDPFRSFTTNDTGIFLSMVETGFGVGVLPESALKKYNYDVVVKDTTEPYYRNLGIIFRKNTEISKSARAFTDYLISFFEDN